MQQKRRRQWRRLESRVGQVPLERAYYYSEHCRKGIFPPDQQLRVVGQGWSEALQKWAVWLGSLLPLHTRKMC